MMVLITGAAGGLGRAFANECASRGYDLLLTDMNGDGLNLIRAGIVSRYPVKVLHYACNLTDGRGVGGLFEYARENGVRLDMLLNVAGVDFEGGFRERSASKILDIVRLNVEATLRVTHEALDHRTPNGRFYMVFVSSMASFYPMPLKATYAASKAFLRDFACAMREELGPLGVNVLTLCPGGLPTTREALDGIEAQGFWGEATANRLESVTRRTIDGVLKGKSLYIPGAVNRLFRYAGAFVPRSLIAKLIYRRWRGAQEKWLNAELGASARKAGTEQSSC